MFSPTRTLLLFPSYPIPSHSTSHPRPTYAWVPLLWLSYHRKMKSTPLSPLPSLFCSTGINTAGFQQTEYRVIVTGLPPSASWQDLKDHMRKAGEPTYTDVVCFRPRAPKKQYETRKVSVPSPSLLFMPRFSLLVWF